jgi:hypothetical protein
MKSYGLGVTGYFTVSEWGIVIKHNKPVTRNFITRNQLINQ